MVTELNAHFTDGRKRRWHQHKAERRLELVNGAINAVRALGHTAGMDEIAGHIGVSKTVLYRYFNDKNDLVAAMVERFSETTVIPNLEYIMSAELGEYELTRAVISTYIKTIASEPELYRFIINNGQAGATVIADSERLIAELLSGVFRDRAALLGVRQDGIDAWAYSIVGAIQLSAHWWTTHPGITTERFIQYQTMIAWSAIKGLIEVKGDPELFERMEHPTPQPPDYFGPEM